MTSLIWEYGRQSVPCSAKFSVTSQTEILSTKFTDFLKQTIFLKSFNLVFCTFVLFSAPCGLMTYFRGGKVPVRVSFICNLLSARCVFLIFRLYKTF